MKTQTQIEASIKNYLSKTSEHLFVNEKEDTFMKIIPFEYNGNQMYCQLRFGNGKASIYIGNVSSKFVTYKNNTLAIIQDEIFKSGTKYHSIPNFKKMKEITAFMYELLNKYDGTKASTDLILSIVKEQLSEIQVLKKELA